MRLVSSERECDSPFFLAGLRQEDDPADPQPQLRGAGRRGSHRPDRDSGHDLLDGSVLRCASH